MIILEIAFLVSVPSSLKKISNELERITDSFEDIADRY